MKVTIIRFVIFSLFTTILLSCTNTEDNLFEEPASIRLEKSKEKYHKILEGAEYGWVLQYFPHPEQKYGGFNYFLTFKNNEVTASLESVEDEVTSSYDLKSRGGVILSFDLYNRLLHFFATPSGNLPKGIEGDFEFLILGEKDDVVELQGLRTGNRLRLLKLKEGIGEYETKIKKIKKYVSKLYYPLKGTIGGVETIIDKGGDKSFLLNKGDSIINKIDFIYTDKGIVFYKSLNVNGKEYSELLFDKENKKLYSEDGIIDIPVNYILVDFYKTSWRLEIEEEANRSSKIKEAWDKDSVINDVILDNEFLLHSYYIIGREENKVGIFSYMTMKETGNKFGVGGFGLDFKIDEKDDSLIHITKGKAYEFAEYYTYVNKVIDVIALNTPYRIELNDDSDILKMVSTSDPDVWFVLTKEVN